MTDEVSALELLTGAFVDDDRADAVPRAAVDQFIRWPVAVKHPVRAPAPHGEEHAPEVVALRGEPIVVPGWMQRVGGRSG